MILLSVVVMQLKGALRTFLSLTRLQASPRQLRLPKGDLNLALIEEEPPTIYQKTLDGRLVPYKRDEAADD